MPSILVRTIQLFSVGSIWISLARESMAVFKMASIRRNTALDSSNSSLFAPPCWRSWRISLMNSLMFSLSSSLLRKFSICSLLDSTNLMGFFGKSLWAASCAAISIGSLMAARMFISLSLRGKTRYFLSWFKGAFVAILRSIS